MKPSPVTWERWHHLLRVKLYSCADCPGSFVPQSVHCIWLPPVKDTKQTMRTDGEVTLALSRSARLYKDNGLTDSQDRETHEIVTCWSLPTWTRYAERNKVLISSGYNAEAEVTFFIKENKSFFVSILTVLICLSFRVLCCIACYKGHS